MNAVWLRFYDLRHHVYTPIFLANRFATEIGILYTRATVPRERIADARKDTTEENTAYHFHGNALVKVAPR